jgi:hypothetical protein
MSVRRLSIALMICCAAFVTGTASTAPAQTFYGACVECHTLTVDEAQGMMEVHGQAFIPEFPEEVCGNCHDMAPHDSPSWPPYWWITPLDPGSYPAGPSVAVQACDTCHDRSLPPLAGAHHPYDTIPYSDSIYPPPESSILPLFTPDGFRDQNPGIGGMTCATCHDAHVPADIIGTDPISGMPKFGFLRISAGDTSALCLYCHSDQGSPTVAYDLFIDRGTESVRFMMAPFDPFVTVEITVTNRGSDPYPGGLMEVMIEEGLSPPYPLASLPIPSINPDQSVIVPFQWDSSERQDDVAFHFIPDFPAPPPLNPSRSNTFIKVFPLTAGPPRPPTDLNATWVPPDASIELAWNLSPDDPPAVMEYRIYRETSPSFDPLSPYAFVPAGTNSYRDANAVPGVTYYYQLRATDGLLYSDPSNTGSATIGNSAPDAFDDSASTPEDIAATIDVLAGDSDPEGDPLTVAAVTQGAHGTVANNGTDVTYTPGADFHGVDTFSYQAGDGKSFSLPATVTVTVAPVNDAPVAGIISRMIIYEGNSATMVVSGQDADDGDTLSFSTRDLPAFCTLIDRPTGSKRIECTTGYDDAGTYEVIVVVTDDGVPPLSGEDTCELIVNNANRYPVAVDDAYATDEDTPLGVSAPGVLGNDDDPDEETLIAIIQTDVGHGTLTLNTDGSFDYAPDPDFFGTDSFSYYARDPGYFSDTAVVSIAVNRLVDELLVASISMSTDSAKGKDFAVASLAVVDELGAPAGGAAVSGHWEGLTGDLDSGTAAADGTVSFVSDSLKNPQGDYCFVVDGVTKSGFTWDTAAGVTSACVTYPSPPEICGDGLDNDGDGLADCDDLDCAGTPECGGACSDITSKDICGSAPDCEWIGNPKSGSCRDAVVCVVTEDPEATCDDGQDNDCDGLTDDTDSDCGGCVPTGNEKGKKCSDGLDNDCDGLTDGADPDC